MKSIILFMFAFQVVAAQNQGFANVDDVNFIDSLGKKQGLWVFTNEMVHGKCEVPNLKVKEGEFKNSRKNGIWKEYFCNEQVKSKITFVNNRPNGYAIIYHENGNIKEEGEWKSNRWIGVYKLYYPNGQVQQQFNFSQTGKRTGKQLYYHDNGQVMIEGDWESGKEAGVITEYYANGDVRSKKDFTGGVIDPTKTQTFEPKEPVAKQVAEVEVEDAPPPPEVDTKKEEVNLAGVEGVQMFNGEGYWQLYNGNKQVTKDGIFKRNRFIEGKAYFYDDDGILIRIAIYKGGKYVGDGIIEE